MRYISAMMAILLFTLCGLHAWAQAPPSQQRQAMVRLRAFIPSDARTARSLGTEREGHGVLIDSDGHILTIGYLILEAEAIEVTGPDGRTMAGTFKAYDHATGFGLVKVDRMQGLHPIELGQSTGLDAGSRVTMLGHGGSEAMRNASIVAREEFVGYWEYLLDKAIYVAPPHPLHSGAAMLNAQGQLVGIGSILTQMVIPPFGLMACNMFVPIDLLKPILQDLIHKGRATGTTKPWLGVNANEVRGRVFVDRVHSDGPAQSAGLLENDIILSVADEPVTGLADLYRKVWALGDAGVDVPLSILQGDRIKKVTLHSADRYQYLHIRPTRKAPPSITEKAI